MAVRNLLTHAGYTVANMTADVGCCGFGGHIIGAAPQLQKKFAERRVGDGEGVKVSYCADCRDVFANEGADARHVLGMLLGIPEDHRRPPELDDRRENRRELKRRYRSSACMGAVLVGEEASSTDGLIQTAAGTGVEDNWNAMNQFSEIRIPVELVEKMNREFVLREQLKDTILSAETDRSMILDEEDHLYYAHKRFREITLWVVYSKQGDIIEVTNLYVHRVEIRESEML